MVNEIPKIINWCNENYGFITAILTVISISLSMIAVFTSIKFSKVQIQTSMFEYRHSVYVEIERIYDICKKFCKDENRGNYISNRRYSSILLFKVCSEEFRTCEKMLQIEKDIIKGDKDIEKLKLEFLTLGNKMVPDIERESQLIHKIKSGFYLLYPEEYHESVTTLLEEYEQLYSFHFIANEEVFDDLIQRMKATIDKLEGKEFSKMMVNFTLKNKK